MMLYVEFFIEYFFCMSSVLQMCTVSKDVPLYTGKTFANYVGLCVIGFRIHSLLGEGQQNADAIIYLQVYGSCF